LHGNILHLRSKQLETFFAELRSQAGEIRDAFECCYSGGFSKAQICLSGTLRFMSFRSTASAAEASKSASCSLGVT
jgi:hypothetical protein